MAAEQVRLRDGRRSAAPATRGPDVTSVVLEVPGDPTRPMHLEAVAVATRRFDDWDLQVLALASQLASVLLEIERARGLRPLAVPLPRDGAAPLIGSTAIMRALRQTVERVAVTDFTILIEGGSGPQPHPGVAVQD